MLNFGSPPPPSPPPEPRPEPPASEPLTPSSSELKVINWRVDEFVRMGFSALHSVMLATIRPTVDLHEAEDLLKAGCPHDVALQILT